LMYTSVLYGSIRHKPRSRRQVYGFPDVSWLSGCHYDVWRCITARVSLSPFTIFM